MRMFKKLVFLGLMLAVILGCQLGGEAAAPVADPVQEEALANTPEPAPEPTEMPSTLAPTNTSIPEPTATLVPQSGDLIYETTFSDINDWEIVTMNNEAGYTTEARSDGLYVKVPDDYDYWYMYYSVGEGINDVRIEADVELVGGTNYTYITLSCRSSEDGEYLFYLDTGGYWHIGKFDYNSDNGYEQLGYGGSNRIKVAKDTNHMTAICEGNELTMLINNHLVGSVQDSQFSEGVIGIGAETLDIPLAEVVFHKLEVYIP